MHGVQKPELHVYQEQEDDHRAPGNEEVRPALPEAPGPEDAAGAAILPEDIRGGLVRLLSDREIASVIYLHGGPTTAKEATLRGIAAIKGVLTVRYLPASLQRS